MKNMKKIALWVISLLALLLIAGCGQQQAKESKTQEPVKLEGEWQAIDFRDTIERTFLFYYNEADSRLKVAEAFQDINPTLKIKGKNVTYSYTADMNKYFDFYYKTNKDQYSSKEEAVKVLNGLFQKKMDTFQHQKGSIDEKTNVVTASLTDAVLDEKAKTIVFPEVPNIFGVLPLFISSKDVPLTYHYELNGDILTIYAEKTFEETGAHLVYPMKFKKVQN